MAQEGNGGGHFRYATMYWSKTDDAMSNTVEITVESAWRRRSASIHVMRVIFPDNGNSHGRLLTIVMLGAATRAGSILPLSSEWFAGLTWLAPRPDQRTGAAGGSFGRRDHALLGCGEADCDVRERRLGSGHPVRWMQVITHTYNTPNHRGEPWTISFGGCCRIDGGVNRSTPLSPPRCKSLRSVWHCGFVPALTCCTAFQRGRFVAYGDNDRPPHSPPYVPTGSLQHDQY
eukprot:3083374-Rhodomonas_salina.9